MDLTTFKDFGLVPVIGSSDCNADSAMFYCTIGAEVIAIQLLPPDAGSIDLRMPLTSSATVLRQNSNCS